jgi:hypothetical protein
MNYLEQKVELAGDSAVRFELPGESQMVADGMHPDAVRQLLDAPWLAEMVTDVIETPEFCEPGEAPDQILRFARDTIVEYIRKRFQL